MQGVGLHQRRIGGAVYLQRCRDGVALMQWLINEFKAFKADVAKKIDDAVANWANEQVQAAEEVKKLRGEIQALKMRMGKNKPE